jgi:hypothetical protein
MLISLVQHEIETALTNHISETMSGLDLNDYDVKIKLIAGRRGNGLRAEVDLEPLQSVTAPTAPENDATPPAAEATEETAEQVVTPFDFGDED